MRCGGGWKPAHGSDIEALPTETGSNKLGRAYGAMAPVLDPTNRQSRPTLHGPSLSGESTIFMERSVSRRTARLNGKSPSRRSPAPSSRCPESRAVPPRWTGVEYARFADDLVILVNSHPRQQWLRQAVEKRLREELAKLLVEVNEEKSRKVDLQRGESFGFLGLEFRRVGSRRGRRMPL